MNPGTPPQKSAPRPARGLFFAGAWVLASAWCSLSGWALSLCGMLDAAGYAASLLAGGALLFLWARRAGKPAHPAPPRRKCLKTLWHKRFRRPLPFLFLTAALLTLAAGSLYAPVNYDALTYRLPRVFNWIADGRWHWIEGHGNRMNYSGVAFEWLMAPVLLLTRTDRLLFLLNFLPWLMLPGAAFTCLREMGVRPRVAWHWMWLLPLGWCYLLQAGGIGNDSYAALYLLLSIGLALRARRTGRIADLWIAAIAAALCTGSKAANLPLLLPFAIAAWPAARSLVPAHKAASLGVALVCLAVSFFPLAVLNQVNTGKWTGDPANSGKMDLRNPAAAFAGNALQLAVHNLEPPVLGSVLNGATARLTRTHFVQALVKDYPRLSLDAGELPVEEGAGAGIGLSLLFLISLAAWFRKPRRQAAPAPRNAAPGYLVSLGAWIALAVYMAKIGSEAAPRLIAAYYPLCFALALIHPGNTALTRRRWWRAAALLASLSIFPALLLNPARPLLPVTALLRAVPGLPARFTGRINTVYTVYAQRSRVLAPLTRYIPPGDRAVAFLGGDDPSTSLWLPFGGRRVVDFSPGMEDRIAARYPGILLIASRSAIEAAYGKSAEEWIRERGARIIAEEPILVKIQRGTPDDWYVLALGTPGGGK